MSDRAYIAALERRIERLERMLKLQFAVSRSTAPSVDSGVVQTNQGKLDPVSTRDAMPTLYNYGFSSSLPVGGDKAVMCLNGDRGQAVVVATGHQTHRFTGLLEGESVFHDMWSHSFRWTQGGGVIVGNLALTGNLTVTGSITATGNITAGFGTGDQVTLQTHKHTSNGTGAATSAPIAGT